MLEIPKFLCKIPKFLCKIPKFAGGYKTKHIFTLMNNYVKPTLCQVEESLVFLIASIIKLHIK
jgi:hypothetical protein